MGKQRDRTCIKLMAGGNELEELLVADTFAQYFSTVGEGQASGIPTMTNRPISVLPILNNIFERAIYNRLINFLDSCNVLYNYQYGFRSKCGTSTALTEVIATIQSELNDDQCATGLFMDLSKAFDTVNHTILLAKLERYGIRGVGLKLFKSYLRDRFMKVNVNGHSSERHKINISVPQWSVLGPVLLYINDMGTLNLRGTLRLLADDSADFLRTTPTIQISNS